MTTYNPSTLSKYADSYGGIIAAFQQIREEQGWAPKVYPQNYKGIIDAIRDLTGMGDTGMSEYPPGWEIITDEDGNIIGGGYQRPPRDGETWFDERQGRLFVWKSDSWYQTNGADGLTAVGTTPPTTEVVGATWYNPTSKGMYIYDGANWNLINVAGTLTANELVLGAVAYTEIASAEPDIYAPFGGTQVSSQNEVNIWIARALKAIETEINNNALVPLAPTGSSVPSHLDNPKDGDLWFDTNDLNLYVFYVDNDSGQWVPAFNTIQDNAEFEALDNQIKALETVNYQQYLQLQGQINALPLDTFVTTSSHSASEQQLQNNINDLETKVGDLSRFVTTDALASEVDDLDARITATEGQINTLSSYSTKEELDDAVEMLEASITNGNFSSTAYVDQKAQEITALIPDISGKANAVDLQNFIATAAANYFPKLGGVLNGTFKMEKSDIAIPSFDFSSGNHYSEKIFKIKANALTNHYSTFGTTSNNWETAWQFAANEDFCWVHADHGKVFSISEDGPACEKLTIGKFRANNTGGRVLVNKIEVGETIRKHQEALESIRQAALNSTTIDQLRSKLIEALAEI